jgi:predicted acylesterase/phospholipase RssA
MKTHEKAKFAAFEGAGGKGIVYAGVVKALEMKDMLPLTNEKRKQLREGSKEMTLLRGVSGSSAGAITAFFIALGANSDDMGELTATVNEETLVLEIELISKSGTKHYPGERIALSNFDRSVISKLKEPLILKPGQTIFSLFYDPPSPGVIKAVGVNPNEQNQNGFLDLDFRKVYNEEKEKELRKSMLATFLGTEFGLRPNPRGTVNRNSSSFGQSLYSLVDYLNYRVGKSDLENDYTLYIGKVGYDFDEAFLKGKQISNSIYKSIFPGLPQFLVSLLLLKPTRKKVKTANQSKDDDFKVQEYEEAVFKDKKTALQYLYSAAYDRGVFTGRYVNRVLAATMHYLIKRNFGEHPLSKDLNVYDCQNMSYFDFTNITGNDLRIGVTNTTRKTSKLCSVYLTPDFPVVSSVAASMSIPVAFKPTFFNGVARQKFIKGTIEESTGRLRVERINRDFPDSTHNQDYRGFLVDGGVLMNLPIHAFDYHKDESKYLTEIQPMPDEMIGIRCAESKPIDEREDANYKKDPLWLWYDQSKPANKLKGTAKLDKPSTQFDINGVLWLEYKWTSGISGGENMLKDTLDTLLYPMEQGQIRSLQELQNTFNFFPYGINVLDFAVPKELVAFVQSRSFIKMGIYLNISVGELVKATHKHYYKQIDENDSHIGYLTDFINSYRDLLSSRKPDMNTRDFT